MGKVIYVVLLLSSSLARAYPCPEIIKTDGRAERLRNWAERWQGVHAIGACRVEITACTAAEGAGSGAVIGELLVTDGAGREAYLPLSVIEPDSRFGRTRLRFYADRLSYLKYDYLFEEEFGRTEAYRLDVRVTADGAALRRLDLGTYATRKKLHGPGENQSRWYNCGG